MSVSPAISSHIVTVTNDSESRKLLEAFREPSVAFRGKPFWSWNGALEKPELMRQMDVLATMGMGGAFMHSRTGLATEYLGEEWFDLINACAEKFENMGLEGWLYDEDRWPSGSAGGMATKDSRYRMRSLVLQRFDCGDVVQWPAKEDFVEAHLAALDGTDLLHYEPLAYRASDAVPFGHSVLIFVREIHPSHSFYNGGSYLDTLSREATDHFIELTHQKYATRCGNHFGKGIRGIFTDEPHRGFILCDGVEQPGATCASHSIPYTERLFVEFKDRFGHCLEGRLPELFYRFRGEAISQLKWHYAELLQQLFIENWARPCLNWCEAHGLLLTGHVLHEDSLAAQVVPCGSLMRYYEQMSYPGIDVLSRGNEAYWVAKQVVSVARQQGKPFVLSELYGCTGWGMAFDEHKKIGDWQAFLGVNLRCPHLSWYTMTGEAKRDYPASIFHQSAWYSQYKYVEDYFSRINLILQQGEPDCDVLVVHPVESVSAQFHLGWATWLRSQSAAVDRIEARFAQLFHWLLDAQIDFDYGDEEQMGRMGRIERERDGVLLRFGEMRYRVVLVGGLETMRASTLELLSNFHAAGGTVIFAGSPPSYLDAVCSDAPAVLAATIGESRWEEAVVVGHVRAGSAQVLTINQGLGQRGVICQVRRAAGGVIYIALVNTRRAPIAGIELSLDVGGVVEQLNCRDGSSATIPLEQRRDGLSWVINLEQLEERVYAVFTENSGSSNAVAVSRESARDAAKPVEVEGCFDYTLHEPNAWVLDCPRLRVGEGDWAAPEDILRIDAALRSRLDWPQRSGQMVQPWLAKSDTTGPEIALEFEFAVDQIPGALALVLEQPERWRIFLNDHHVAVPVAPDWFIDVALKRVPLSPEWLLEGNNRLRLETVIRPDTDLEAVYLMGDFGLYCEGREFRMGNRPEQIRLGDITEQGFPFYTGPLTYHCPVPAAGADAAFLEVELPAFAGACVEIVTAQGRQAVAFPPYRERVRWTRDEATQLDLKLYLTRRNLFGPLHQLPVEQLSTGPDSFRTEGTAFSLGVNLVPGGLLAAPLVRLLNR